MKRIQLSELANKVIKCLNIGEVSRVYLLNDGRILKIFDTQILSALKTVGVDIESKVLNAENITLPNEILKPETAVYNGFTFIGNITNQARGIDYNSWDNTLTLQNRADLFMYAQVHYNLESIIKSTPDIVYPDICTCDNIYINPNDGNRIQLIDYDGLQVGHYPSISISTTLGEISQYLHSKKYMNNNLFTKELDKKSLIMLYFLNTFNVDLNKVGKRNPSNGQIITLDYLFECLNLNDNDIKHKVWQIFYDKKHNDWLGADVFRLAEEYHLEVLPIPVKRNIYLKKLIRK